MKRSHGVTLVELLSALVISAIVVTLISRVYLSGHREFLGRLLESDQLTALVKAKRTLDKALMGKINHCKSGHLGLVISSTKTDMETWLHSKIPTITSSSFHCFERDEATGEIVEWSGRFQPQLVEYRVQLVSKNKSDWLEGSVLK